MAFHAMLAVELERKLDPKTGTLQPEPLPFNRYAEVATVSLPDFVKPPEVLLWGTRVFAQTDVTKGPLNARVYVEVFAYSVNE